MSLSARGGAEEPLLDGGGQASLGTGVCPGTQALLDPAQGRVVGVARIVDGLADAVDLIVMATVRKAEELLLERGEPRRLRGEEHLPGFDASGGDRHSAHLVALGLDRLYVEAAPPQLSDQRRPDAAVFDQDLRWSVHVCVSDREPLQGRIVVAAAQHVFEVVLASCTTHVVQTE